MLLLFFLQSYDENNKIKSDSLNQELATIDLEPFLKFNF